MGFGPQPIFGLQVLNLVIAGMPVIRQPTQVASVSELATNRSLSLGRDHWTEGRLQGPIQLTSTSDYYDRADPMDNHLADSGRQFRITFRDDVSCVLSVMIRNRLPSGAMSQLMGPLRMPVSTMSVSNRARGVPERNVC